MLMPLIYPLLLELDALIDGLDIKILGSPVGKYIRTMLNIESMTDLEQGVEREHRIQNRN